MEDTEDRKEELNSLANDLKNFDILLTAHLNIYLDINQLDALDFIMSLFHASTCFEHTCSKHVEA